MKSLNELLKKLDQPPGCINWVRFISTDQLDMANSIARFAIARPSISYVPGMKTVKDRIELQIDRRTALHAINTKGAPRGRKPNASFVNAFFDFDETERLSDLRSIRVDREYFRISRDLKVPVAPTSIVIEDEKLVPIFICGWSELSLDEFQRRVFMTVVEDAYLSLTDFQESPAKFLFFPNAMIDGIKKRQAIVWERGDYQLLRKKELDQIISNYLGARRIARQIIEKMHSEKTKDESVLDRPESLPLREETLDLFGKE